MRRSARWKDTRRSNVRLLISIQDINSDKDKYNTLENSLLNWVSTKCFKAFPFHLRWRPNLAETRLKCFHYTSCVYYSVLLLLAQCQLWFFKAVVKKRWFILWFGFIRIKELAFLTWSCEIGLTADDKKQQSTNKSSQYGGPLAAMGRLGGRPPPGVRLRVFSKSESHHPPQTHSSTNTQCCSTTHNQRMKALNMQSFSVHKKSKSIIGLSKKKCWCLGKTVD